MAPITSIYAALLAILFVALSIRVIRVRHRTGLAFGTGSEAALERRVRVQANWAEYVPISLLILMLVEGSEAPDWLVHGLGVVLIVGRTAHAYGVSQAKENLRYRVTGMAMTFGVIIASALYLLGEALA